MTSTTRTAQQQRESLARLLTFAANIIIAFALVPLFVNAVVENNADRTKPLTPGMVPWSWSETP